MQGLETEDWQRQKSRKQPGGIREMQQTEQDDRKDLLKPRKLTVIKGNNGSPSRLLRRRLEGTGSGISYTNYHIVICHRLEHMRDNTEQRLDEETPEKRVER